MRCSPRSDAFERAIAADRAFAQAWGGLAMTYAVLPAYTNRLATAASAERSLDAAQRALALDPAQPEPYLAMGNVAQPSRGAGKRARRCFAGRSNCDRRRQPPTSGWARRWSRWASWRRHRIARAGHRTRSALSDRGQ